MKTTITFTLIIATLLSAGSVSAQILQVAAVSVDTCWNSDSAWYDDNGILQQRISRDCQVSFIPQGEGMARMFIAMSIDSGKTWGPSSNPLQVMNNALMSTFITGQKATITVRVLGGDRPGTVFKMTARQAGPMIAGSPDTVILGLSGILNPGQTIGAALNLRLAGATQTDGFCTISKVYWDALGDGTIDDSTAGVGALAWTWLTQVPAGMLGQKRGVIARAIDKNGLSSQPETLSVKFGVGNDSVTDIDGNVYYTIKIGTQEWTIENLRVTRYNDETVIPMDTSTATWNSTTAPKYCFYNNTTNTDSIKKFGALYNWYVIDPANVKKIAPAGWHVPDTTDWNNLETWLIANGYNWDGTTTGNKIAKALAGQTDWYASTLPGVIGNDLKKNNSSGFSALPGGYRDFIRYDYIGISGWWWSTTVTKNDAFRAYCRSLYNNDCPDLCKSDYYTCCGFSVRLVRD